jgi:NAD+ synthase
MLALNSSIVEKILVSFIRGEVRKVGFEKVALGLSGGIDSAVSAALAVKALGAENVLGVMMPYKTSSPESLSDAKLVAEAFGFATEQLDITQGVDGFLKTAPDANALRQGNVMARMRMITLYDVSARDKRLVIGTSNKTELLLGYGTLFGDMASAINPIGDLYKTQVWELARHLGVPVQVIDKKPSADLWQGQTDEQELGFSYADADKLLFLLIDQRLPDADILAAGIEKAFLDKMKKRIVQNQFKRLGPVIAKVSGRTLGIDFRYARDWQVVK